MEIRKARALYRDIPIQAKASFWYLICSFLQKGISFITTPIFTRLLNTSEFGQYNIFNSWLNILTVCISLNLSSGIYTRGLVKYEDSRDEFTSSLEGLSLTLILCWSIVYFIFPSFWNGLFSMTTVQMVSMFLIIWTTGVYNFWSKEQRFDYKYQKLIAVTLAMSIAKPVLGIVLVSLSQDKVTARILGLAIVEIVISLPLYIVYARKGRKFFSAKFWKNALIFNIPLIPHYLSTTVLNGADRIMIGRMVSESAAGIYGLAYSISLVMTMFNTALLHTIEPWLYRRIKEKRTADIGRIAYPCFAFIAFLNILVIAFAPEITAIFAPPEYIDAIWIIPPVAMSAFFMFSYSFFAVFEFYFEKTRMIALATCAGAVLNIILNYIFIKIYGYYAAGYTTLFCYMVYAAFHFLSMRKICRERLDNCQPYSVRIYLVFAGLLLFSGFAFLAVYPHAVIRYGLIGIMLLFIVLFRKRTVNEIKVVLNAKKQ